MARKSAVYLVEFITENSTLIEALGLDESGKFTDQIEAPGIALAIDMVTRMICYSHGLELDQVRPLSVTRKYAVIGRCSSCDVWITEEKEFCHRHGELVCSDC